MNNNLKSYLILALICFVVGGLLTRHYLPRYLPVEIASKPDSMRVDLSKYEAREQVFRDSLQKLNVKLDAKPKVIYRRITKTLIDTLEAEELEPLETSKPFVFDYEDERCRIGITVGAYSKINLYKTEEGLFGEPTITVILDSLSITILPKIVKVNQERLFGIWGNFDLGVPQDPEETNFDLKFGAALEIKEKWMLQFERDSRFNWVGVGFRIL